MFQVILNEPIDKFTVSMSLNAIKIQVSAPFLKWTVYDTT